MHREIRASLTRAGWLSVALPLPVMVVLLATVIFHPELTGGERFVTSIAIVLMLVCSASIALFLRRLDREVGMIADVSEERSRKLTHDEGTGALLRRFFLDACERQIAANETTPAAYFAVDMDFLKQLNDSLGHQAGDAALRQLVTAIRKRFPTALVGRLGGDEFAFFVACADAGTAAVMADALLGDLAQPFQFAGKPLALSATIGTTLVPEQTRFVTEAVQFSDLALYEGKRQGRSRATLFSRQMLSEFRHERQIEREILVGLEREQFSLVYRPLTDANGTTVALRAIVEWESAWLGRVERDHFIKVADSSTLIDRLGRWAIERACEEASLLGDVPVCIPVSAVQLRREEILFAVAAALERTGVAPARIILELEGCDRIVNNSDAARRLRALADSGVRISSDSFWPLFADEGTPTSPMHYVRIADSAIATLGSDGRQSIIVASVAMLAQQAGIVVVAEGIATAEAATIARAASCDIFAPPPSVPALSAKAYVAQMPRPSSIRAA